jgi:hypothetical protein
LLRVPGTQSDGTVYGDNFLPTGGTRTQLESRRARGGYFFSSASNLMGIRYFTTAMILGCEQLKMCSFCYINYDLCQLLNFATGYLTYLLNNNFKHVYIMLYLLN